ncbi:MAG: prenyltransferase/squalene oxidase repeat-containing protein, partial [Planctomycetota bacterium]
MNNRAHLPGLFLTALLTTVSARPAEPDPTLPGQDGDRAAHAVRYLLAGQAADGTWGGEAEVLQNSATSAPAVTSIVLLALRSLPEIADSADLRAAVASSVEEGRSALLRCLSKKFLDNPSKWQWNWAGAFSLLCLAQFHREHPSEELRGRAQDLIRLFQVGQNRNGGWNYLMDRLRWKEARGEKLSEKEKEHREKWPYSSMSFMTAPIVIALVEARAAGLDVPEAVIEAAVKSLKASRTETGTYVYKTGSRGDYLAGSASRNVAIDLALLLAGKGDR